jgi:hypothetical protein
MSVTRQAGEGLQQRTSVRYRLRVPVICNWTGPGGRLRCDGFTRDISTQGVFVLCSTPPALGTAVVIELVFPPLEATSGVGPRLKAVGRVVRVEGSNGTVTGFATASDFSWETRLRHDGRSQL